MLFVLCFFILKYLGFIWLRVVQDFNETKMEDSGVNDGDVEMKSDHSFRTWLVSHLWSVGEDGFFSGQTMSSGWKLTGFRLERNGVATKKPTKFHRSDEFCWDERFQEFGILVKYDHIDHGVDQDSQLTENGILQDGSIWKKGSQFEIAIFGELAPHLSLNIDISATNEVVLLAPKVAKKSGLPQCPPIAMWLLVTWQ